MKGCVKIRGNSRNILVVLPAAIVMLFAFAIMLPVVSESTHAEGDEPEEGISITISDPVSANLVLFDEGDYKIAKDTVQVSSSAPYGYELFLSTDSEEHQSIYLNNDPTSSSVISPVSGTIAEPAVLTSNTWGFAIAGQGNFDNEYSTTSPDPNSKFAIIPTTNDQAVYENRSADADDDIDFYYGIKIEPTLEPGEYTTSASYTAIAKLPPLTAKAILGSNGNLNFLYDRNAYAVGETYEDNIGETTIDDVFAVPTNCNSPGDIEWMNNSAITSANFGPSFYGFKPTSTAFWFQSSTSLASITNADNLDTSRVTNMYSMFGNAGYNASTFSLNLSGWKTDNVTYMEGMFSNAGRNATTWTIGDLSNWKVGNVEDMDTMFYQAGYTATTWTIGDLSKWSTGNVTSMYRMFYNAGYNANTWNIGDISGWNVDKVRNHSQFINRNAKPSNTSVLSNQPHWK
ncbi:MAG: BspA family leucine-rich repeat surface protein [Candidatus Saccharibacteria bacterium]|nr:BspA family leucine-rich repeat surface protein [Candidatus Saccharibacteria bacterium]